MSDDRAWKIHAGRQRTVPSCCAILLGKLGDNRANLTQRALLAEGGSAEGRSVAQYMSQGGNGKL